MMKYLVFFLLATCVSSLNTSGQTRRSVIAGFFGSVALLPAAANAEISLRENAPNVTPFNGLIFNYRGSDVDASLKASDIDGPSISYKEFVDKLNEGEVEQVEFIAPDGDVCFAKLKGKDGPVRIGEGYPLEQHDGWSSPAFAVRTVQRSGVPYKFTVPALASFK